MPRAEHRLVFESFGVTAEVASDDEALFESLPTVLPPGWKPADGEPRARFGLMRDGAVTLDGDEVARAKGGPEDLLIRLGSTVRHRMALLAPDHVFIHAGVVSVSGISIVIPGPSHSGKSTLVAELLRAGATYHSDEYAPIDADGMIAPYAKPMSIRGTDANGLGRLHPVPKAQVAEQPIAAGLVVVTRYEAGATWRPSPRTGGEGALALLENTVAARPQPGRAMAVVSQLAREARVVSGIRGEAGEMVDALLDLATGRAPGAAGLTSRVPSG